jgi:dynein heavy chain, axonemal
MDDHVVQLSLEKVFAMCVERNLRGEQSTMFSVLSQNTYSQCFEALVKWVLGQFDLGRAVNCQGLGIMGYNPALDNPKAVCIQLEDAFIQKYNLTFKFDERECPYPFTPGPSIKINYVGISKTGNLEKSVVSTAVQSIFDMIGVILNEHTRVELDLGILGKLSSYNRAVKFSPVSKNKTAYLFGKSTVKNLMESGKNMHEKLPPLEQSFHLDESLQKSPIPQKNNTFNNYKPQVVENKGLSIDMLGAGLNPYARISNYSSIASDPDKMISTRFKKPQLANTGFPPVLNIFSRTVAAPVSFNKQYISPSVRIASNYNPEAKSLVIDAEARCIKFIELDSGITLVANTNPLIPQTPTIMSGSITATGTDSSSLNHDYISKRYSHYIENEITTEVIAPIRQYWIHKILDFVPAEWKFIEKEQVEFFLDEMLNEINKDYYSAIRKSILDYVLKDPNQLKRLGFEYNPNPPVDYGSSPYRGLEPTEEWQTNVMMARMLMSDNLCICSPAISMLRQLWVEYETLILVDLPQTYETLTIDEFIEKQETRMNQIYTLLTNDWTQSASTIILDEIKDMEKDQSNTLCQAASTLMSNELRQLITDSLKAYHVFFKKFESDDPPRPTQMISSIPNEWPDAFLKIEISAQDNKISFSSDIKTISKKLKLIVKKIAEKSEKIHRPDQKLSEEKNPYLRFVNKKEDELVLAVLKDVKRISTRNLEIAFESLELYKKYSHLLSDRVIIEKFIDGEHKRRDYQDLIEKYSEIEKDIRKECPGRIRLNMVEVDCTEINRILRKECNDIINIVCKAIQTTNFNRASNVYKEFDTMSTLLSNRADSEEKLVENEKYKDKCRNEEIPKLLEEYKDIKEWIKMLYDLPFEIEEELTALKQCHIWVKKILEVMQSAEVRLQNEKDTLINQLKEYRKSFIDELNSIDHEINKLRNASERGLFDEYCDTTAVLKQRLEESEEKMKEINSKEVLLGWEPTEFAKLEEAQKTIKNYDELWKLAALTKKSIESWNITEVKKLDPEEIERQTRQMQNQARGLYYKLKEKTPKPAEVAQILVTETEDFMKKVPLMKIVCTKGLEERHFEKIDKILGKSSGNFKIDDFTTFKYLWDLDLANYINQIDEVAQGAAREFSNQKMLDKMEKDWESVEFELKDWGETKTYIHLGGAIEIIQTLLEEQILTTQTMKGSPYAVVYLKRINIWDEWLNLARNAIEVWIKVQALWIGLEPVFASADIQKQLAKESAIFKEADNNWHRIMDLTHKNPIVTIVTKIDGLLPTLKQSLEKLEIVQRELNNYLEKKRLFFPRFFFLSNEELLSILKETRDPTKVQPHLKKCFEGIKSLKFDEEQKISAMVSQEGEVVEIIKIIDPANAEGAVERWLIEVEECMLKSTRECIIKALNDYPKKERRDWVCLHKGQAVLCAGMTFWTRGAEDKMINSGRKGLQEYAQECIKILNDVVTLVRGDISELVRCTLKALIVLDVHCRDVIAELVTKGVEDKNDFGWLAQMRYYWENDNSWIRIINAQLAYGYEYLGNSERLVITPLTDRCYRTLCGALDLYYGGAPEGPAGTGKTETVKDLAKAMARMCVVFNCSDGLDFEAMGKFFKGLSATGGWSCFDEFNRIDPEVLSVVAQQLLTIQNAIKEGKTEFEFEGTILPVKKTCNCFITMNPGYAGRSELPDNLKALFRTVAMMVPDYSLIAENVLYSYGFHDARPLAQKIVATYKLCSEQLSSQKHYDYGMRAVKSVLTAAGNLKRRYPNENESIIMLRSINDVNLAKFLSHDLPLFEGIASDLFPGVKLPEPDYANLMQALENQSQIMNLQFTKYFTLKVIQLYEMVNVRHGLMIVGFPFAGKTSAIKLLAAALTELAHKQLMNENEVLIYTLNPKSINMKQLYGAYDEVSKDWQDGVLAAGYKEFARNETNQRKWMHFDGPVDAIWIENMNTVLDDNKKLCLTSGEIIAMSSNMNLVFEPMDLAVASPATVSRCGMVYVEPDRLGWEPLFQSWRNISLPKTFFETEELEVNMLADWLIEPTLKQIETKMKLIAPMMRQNLVMSLLKLFGDSLKYFNEQNVFESIEEKERIKIIDCLFVFSMVWSLGAAVVSSDRRTFTIWLRRLISLDVGEIKNKGKKIQPVIPENGSYFDYIYLVDQKNWRHWTEAEITDINAEIPSKILPNEIIVATVDTVRYTYLLEKMILANIPHLFCGGTGTGKTVYVKDVLLNKLSQIKFINAEVGFSAQTTANQVQDTIDGKVDCRRGRGVFGPPPEKICVIFIDDLNMPEKESYGAQPPIEILRQLLDQSGWYERKDNTFKKITDIRFVSAMGPPGGGRTFITPRFQRHLSMISLADFEDDTLLRIFSSILHWFFTNFKFNENVTKVENKIVQATRDIYKTAMEKLLPTPLKSHYTFNLRDFSKVILGICMADAQTTTETDEVIRLWVHEILRVFGDRLVDDTDRLWLLNHVRESTKRIFGVNFDNVFNRLDIDKNGKVETLDEIRGLMFGNLMSPMGALKKYEEMKDYNHLLKNCETSLDLYNTSSGKPMELVLFAFAIEHLCRVSRILNQPGGHALLVGVGGSGRQSLTKLAACIAEFELFQIELTKNYGKVEWHEDLKKFIRRAGCGDPTVFLFTDSHIKDKSFLEDINTLLNTGEVPNLYEPEEKIEICEVIRPAAKSEGKAPDGTLAQLYSFFVQRCKKMLHIVLCFSPIGEAFRTRLRMFPSLVNCTTIDWFSEWPQDALLSVAQKFLHPIEMSAEVKGLCVDMCQLFHRSTIDWSRKMLMELKRNYYVTPTSYLEMITTFKTLLLEKRKMVSEEKQKFEIGYEKLITTENSVESMRTELTNLQPQLIEAQKETDSKIIIVDANKKEAEIMEVSVREEELIARTAANKAEAIKIECDAALSVCLPILQEAIDALNVLNKDDISKIKKSANPPQLVKDVMEAICILFEIEPPKKQNPDTMKMEPQWWEASQKMLSKADFLKDLQVFEKEKITEKQIKALQKFIQNPDFNPENMRNKISSAAAGLCSWVCAMEKFYHVNLEVIPKQKAQQAAEEEYNRYMKNLEIKEAELKVVQDKVAALQADLDQTLARKDKLEHDVDECKRRLIRAQQLIESLGGEKVAWKEYAIRLGQDYIALTGDVLVSSGMIAYSGPFTAAYRAQITLEWSSECVSKKIPSSSEFSLQSCLGDPVKIRLWNIDGLPRDSFSIENGIIISKARRWPLLIDPESQANKWIRKMEGKENTLLVLKLTDDNFLRMLENKITFGHPVLLENVGEELDPSLEPLLLKQVVKNILRLGESNVEYNKDFKFYITTRLRNPHYLPELSTKVTLLNFMITPEGLADQLLVTVVAEEQPELARTKEHLIIQTAENQKKQKQLQEKILYIMSTSSGNILDDDEAIQVLSQSKVVSNQIEIEQANAKVTEEKIDKTRMEYKPFSDCISLLFFCITELGNIDPMYQYSLDFFNNLFVRSIRESEASEVLETRLKNLQKHFTKSLYVNICRSLFEKDRLLFAFNLTLKFMEFDKELDMKELRFLMTGGIGLDEKLPEKPEQTWLLDKTWAEFCRLSDLEKFSGFYQDVRSRILEWKEVFEHPKIYEAELPGKWDKHLNIFQKLLVYRCLRPDSIVAAITEFVAHKLGKEFISNAPLKLKDTYKDSSRNAPLIFILSAGSDPFRTLKTFADLKKKNLIIRSLGQGQGKYAEENINVSQETGDWVLLMNCHLADSWMPRLEYIVQNIPAEVKGPGRDFRLWLTSYPSPKFPVTLLQNGMKMTNEPPKGLKANLYGSYNKDFISDPHFFNSCKKEKEWKKLLYGLCFFNAVIQERRMYGPLGWNIPYEFSESDLRISVQQLQLLLNQYEKIPFEALLYLTGECNFGGRVTDDKDRRLIMTLLNDYYNENMFKDTYKFSGINEYFAPPLGDYQSYLDQIDLLPNFSPPGIFGFHPNADITKNQNEAASTFNSMLLTQSAGGGGGGSVSIESLVTKIAEGILADPPEVFDEEAAQKKYPPSYNESMNTVLTQELIRFNNLSRTVKSSLQDLIKAIKGMIPMSAAIELTLRMLFDGKVPKAWQDVSYPSLKPLGSYIGDLKQRLEFFKQWFLNGSPVIYEISRFFFTQSFLTGALQNYARKYTIPIDEVQCNFEIINFDIAGKPEDGVYIKGMFLEGARWSKKKGKLDESRPKRLFTDCPMIWIKPATKILEFKHYECPVYKTSVRRGELSTTGHSTNFVMMIRLATEIDPSHWIKRGVALLTQLDD